MKTVITLAMLCALWLNVMAQVPQKMSYQAVIRDAEGDLVTNTQVGMRITILEGALPGTDVYQEIQTPTTNDNGLVTIEIGGGTGFDTIHWENGLHFIRTETDPAGSTNYTISGTSQLLSVPYALHAKSVQSVATDATLSGVGQRSSPLGIAQQSATNGQVLKWDGISWTPANDNASLWQLAGPNIYYADGNAGVGTSDPNSRLHLNSSNVFTGLLMTNDASGTTSNDGFLIGSQYQADMPENRYALILNQENSPLHIGTNDKWPGDLTILPGGNIGIATTGPTSKLDINGQVRIRGGIPGAGKVLMSDATGLATWQTPAPGGLTLPYEGSVTSEEPAFEVINNAEGTAMGEGTAIYAQTKSSTGRALNGYASSATGLTNGIMGSANSNQGIGVQGIAYSTAGTTTGVKGVVYSATGYSGFFDGGWFYVQGNVGIGKTMPAYKLDVKANSRIQLTKSDGSWLAMRTDGSLLDFSFSGHNLTIKSDTEGENILLNPASKNKVGIRTWLPEYDLDVNGTLRTTGAAVFSNVGIGDATPDASLDVEGSVAIGSSGKIFSEIREITGNLDADGVCPVSYPAGYTMSNMRVLSLEINYNGDAWLGLAGTDMAATNIMKVFYYLGSSNILIYYPNVASFHNKPFRMLVMKVQ